MKTYLPRKRAEFQLIEDIKDLCRLCLSKCEMGVPIYANNKSEAQPLLATKIMMCVGIEIPYNSDLTNNICLDCSAKIEGCYAFRKMCELAYQRIKLHILAIQQIQYKEQLQKRQDQETSLSNNLPNIDNGCTTIKSKELSCDPKTITQHEAEKNEIVHSNTDQRNVTEYTIQEVGTPFIKTKIEPGTDKPLSPNHQILINNALNVALPISPNCEQGQVVNDILNGSSNNYNQYVDQTNRTYHKKAKEDSNSGLEGNNAREVKYKECRQSNNSQTTPSESNPLQTTTLVEVMSKFILSQLVEAKIVRLEGEDISTCDIGTIQLATPYGDIVSMELEEEDVEDKVPVTKKGTSKLINCETCGISVRKNSLRRHMLRHSGVKRYSCDVCSRTFAQHTTLKRHRLTHAPASARPYKCGECARAFTQRPACAAHERSHRRGLRLHSCTTCPKVFLHASGLTRHLYSHIGKVYNCADCKKDFVDSSSLKRHQAICPDRTNDFVIKIS